MENQEVEKIEVKKTEAKKAEGKKNKQAKPKEAKEKIIRLHVQDAHQRLNFLHQIALQLSSRSKHFSCFLFLLKSLGTDVNDGFAKLGRNIGKHFRGVLDTETVKVEPDIMRMFCKNCKQVFLAKVMFFHV